MLQAIGAVLQLILLIFSKWAERDADKRKKKETLQKELSDAIKNKDVSAVNVAISRINRLR